MPLLISLLSFIVATVSAVFAYTLSRDAYESDRRSELIGYLQEFNRLSAEGGLQEDEAQTLVAQASWIVSSVPDVPPAVYRQLGQALLNEAPIYQEEALPFLDRAIELARVNKDEYEQIAALRTKARIYENQREIEAMRDQYQLAVALSDDYEGPNIQRRHTVPAFTHVYWGGAEARSGYCEKAAEQHTLAQEHAAILTGSNLDEEIRQLESSIQECRAR
jgi:tetratricopeptide (TPR) repeat protein